MQAVTIDREKYIGGSDIPIIMGISQFKSRFDLLLEKAGLKDNDFTGNEYTEYGNVMESQIRDYININRTDKFEEGKYIENDIRCHTDGINSDTVLEIKTTSQIHNRVEDYKVYLVQLLFYMEYNKREFGKLAVYERPSNFDEKFNAERLTQYDIRLQDFKELVEEINKAVDQFRIDLAKVKENPLITEEELLPVDLTDLSNKLVIIENQLKQYDETIKQQKELKAQLKFAMEKNNIKTWETPNGVKFTLVEDKPDEIVKEKVINEELFRSENIELVEQYELKQAEYLEEKEIVRKGKAGYVKITSPKGD